MLRIFMPVKIQLLRPGLNPQTWVPEASMLTTRPPKPSNVSIKVKVIPQQTEVAQGVPGRLRPRIFLTFGTTRVVGRQPYAPAAFTPPLFTFRDWVDLMAHGATEKIPSDTIGNRSRVRLVAQCLNHYATPGPLMPLLVQQIYTNVLHQYHREMETT